MPRTPEANQRIRADQRTRILEAAWRVFGRGGMSVTMAEIAEAAGVSYGLVYRYFSSKEVLLDALGKHAMQTLAPAMETFREMRGTPGQRLDALVSMVIASRREHPEMGQALNQIMSDDAVPPALRELIAKQGEAYRGVMRALIVQAQATGEVLPGDPDQLLTFVLACLDGLSSLAARDPREYRERVPDAEILLRMLRPYSGSGAQSVPSVQEDEDEHV